MTIEIGPQVYPGNNRVNIHLSGTREEIDLAKRIFETRRFHSPAKLELIAFLGTINFLEECGKKVEYYGGNPTVLDFSVM